MGKDQAKKSLSLWSTSAIGMGEMVGGGIFAAMLSTASAINATLYGSMRVSYIIAKDG